jgi:Cu+-exporting ATPase
MKNNKINITDNIESDLHKQESLMKTTVIISSEKEILGLVSVADAIKTNSKSAIDKFHEMNIKTKMITGDNKLTSEKVAKKVGITEVISDVMPQDKLDNVKKLQTENHHVVFIGDGINDAPALAQSDVGIAIGGGTDIARESGDIVLVNGDITDAVGSIQIAKKVMKRIHQNLFWAFAYNIILIPIAAGILTPWNILFRPEYSAFAMALSSVTVVTLSLLLKNYTPDIYKKEDNE